jgi:hypothetical protein
MGKPSRATQEKRNRERAQKERQQDKEEKRALRGNSREDRSAARAQGLDPDLVGIFPGPQAPQEN